MRPIGSPSSNVGTRTGCCPLPHCCKLCTAGSRSAIGVISTGETQTVMGVLDNDGEWKQINPTQTLEFQAKDRETKNAAAQVKVATEVRKVAEKMAADAHKRITEQTFDLNSKGFSELSVDEQERMIDEDYQRVNMFHNNDEVDAVNAAYWTEILNYEQENDGNWYQGEDAAGTVEYV